MSVNFDNVTTLSQIEDLWTQNQSNAKQFYSVASGDVYVMITNKGSARLIKIVSLNSGTDEISVKGAKP